MEEAKNTGNPVYFAPGSYGLYCPSGLGVADTTYSLIGYKAATLKAMVAMTVPMVTIGGTEPPPYSKGRLDGLTFDCNHLARTAIFYGGPGLFAAGYTTMDSNFENCLGNGAESGNNFWLGTFINDEFTANAGWGFKLGAGDNAGENISFHGGSFSNNASGNFLAQDSGAGGASVGFHSVSFDYTPNVSIQNGTSKANSTVMTIEAGHIETPAGYIRNYGILTATGVAMFNGSESKRAGYLIDNQGRMILIGGWIQNGGSGSIFRPTIDGRTSSYSVVGYGCDAGPHIFVSCVDDTGVFSGTRMTSAASNAEHTSVSSSAASYNEQGILLPNAHSISLFTGLSGGVASVTLRGPATYTGKSTYQCNASYNSGKLGKGVLNFNPLSGSHFTITSSNADDNLGVAVLCNGY
jgi:hypothetical protein